MSSPLDEQALHQERAELILALNGNPVNAEMGWQIIHRWDALVNVAKAAEQRPCNRFDITPCSQRPEIDEDDWCPMCKALAALNKEPV